MLVELVAAALTVLVLVEVETAALTALVFAEVEAAVLTVLPLLQRHVDERLPLTAAGSCRPDRGGL